MSQKKKQQSKNLPAVENILAKIEEEILSGRKFSEVMQSDDISELSPLAKQFAMESALSKERITLVEWADRFGVHFNTIIKWKNDPRVNRIIDAIRNDFYKVLAAQTILLARQAYDTYFEILTVPPTKDTLEVKRRAAQDVMSMFKTVDVNDFLETDSGVTVGGVKTKGSVDDIDLDSLADDVKELKMLEEQLKTTVK